MHKYVKNKNQMSILTNVILGLQNNEFIFRDIFILWKS